MHICVSSQPAHFVRQLVIVEVVGNLLLGILSTEKSICSTSRFTLFPDNLVSQNPFHIVEIKDFVMLYQAISSRLGIRERWRFHGLVVKYTTVGVGPNVLQRQS